MQQMVVTTASSGIARPLPPLEQAFRRALWAGLGTAFATKSITRRSAGQLYSMLHTDYFSCFFLKSLLLLSSSTRGIGSTLQLF